MEAGRCLDFCPFKTEQEKNSTQAARSDLQSLVFGTNRGIESSSGLPQIQMLQVLAVRVSSAPSKMDNSKIGDSF